jgi:hypothetical protein
MNVHLIKDYDVKNELYFDIHDLINQFSGPISFIKHYDDYRIIDEFKETKIFTEDDFNESNVQNVCYSICNLEERSFPIERIVSHPDTILRSCRDFRIVNKNIHVDDIVILITNKNNKYNWFSYADHNNNAFINTDDWSYFIECDNSFPISHQVASKTLQMLMFENIEEYMNNTHRDRSIGCINDFCKDKRDIILKLRTADICNDCLKIIKQKSIKTDIINQITKILEGLRSKMLSIEKFKQSLKPSKLYVNPQNGDIHLFDLGNTKVKLTPLEKTVYHLFINHPEGIAAHDFQDYQEEVKNLYYSFSKSIDLENQKKNLKHLLSPMTNSLQEKLSNIKRKYRELVDLNHLNSYIIQRDRNDGKYKLKFKKDFLITRND